MKGILKKYLLFLDKLYFRKFMYVPVSMFIILFIVVIVSSINAIYVSGMSCFNIFFLLLAIPVPFQFYFILRIFQWFTAKLGCEKLYELIFKANKQMN